MRTHVCKHLTPDEAERAAAFEAALADRPGLRPRVVDFELYHMKKVYMIMPRLPATLEPMPSLADEDVARLWDHVSRALDDVHGLGFAHMDVKPSNIGIDGGDGFVLIDLGSIGRFGDVTSSTWPYVPADLRRPGARWTCTKAIDWWMFAMTLAEKGCGDVGLNVGGHVSGYTREVLRTHLELHLRGDVWGALSAKLEG